MTMMRLCKKCQQTLPLNSENFHKSGETYHTMCKMCRRKQSNASYAGISETLRQTRFKADKKRNGALRLKTLTHYCDGLPYCQCCGEKELVFLTLDHINNDGNEHRTTIGVGGLHLYRWAEKNNYPRTLQVLCRNCNWAKHVLGKCVHQS